MSVYQNTIHNIPPTPCYYVLHLTSTNSNRASGSSWYWRINIPSVSSVKQYYIRPTRVFIQDLNPVDTAIRAVVIRTDSCRLQNSYSSGLVSGDGAGYSNILGVCEISKTIIANIQHNYVAYMEEPHTNFMSGGFVNGSILQGGEFNIRICDLNNNDISFNATTYADAFFEVSIYEIHNPQYSISADIMKTKNPYTHASPTQVQGGV